MAVAYISNGVRCSYMLGIEDYTAKSLEYLEKGETIARENKLHELHISALLKKSAIQLNLANREKAEVYLDQAESVSPFFKHSVS